GLGLPLVNKIVEQLDGSIKIDSDAKVKRGTTISIVLQNYEPSIEEEIVKHLDQNTPNAIDFTDIANLPELKFRKNLKTVMIIGDNINMLHYVLRKFDNCYNIIPATSVSNALHILNTIPYNPDLIPSDYMMDAVNNLAFYKILVNNDKLN